ncbi:MAG: hypothetical protein SGILL_001518 [Bacillariaceae sp.]
MLASSASSSSSSSSIPFGPNFVADAVEKVLPSVVRIEVHAKSVASNDSDSDSADTPLIDQRGSGSGFVVRADDVLWQDKEGEEPDETSTTSSARNDEVLILTNAHCILTPEEFAHGSQHTTKTVYLEFVGDTENNNSNSDENSDAGSNRILTGTIVAFDTKRDVALIRPHFDRDDDDDDDVFGLQGHRMRAASLLLNNDKSTTVRHGEFVAALGAPLELENTVTVGIVSNPRRRCRHDDHKLYIQTDNSCHIGNSGGPLINMDGKVIGITAKKVADGIAYSIPISHAVESLRKAYFVRNRHHMHHHHQQLHQQSHTSHSSPEQRQQRESDSKFSHRQSSDSPREAIVDPHLYSLYPYCMDGSIPVSMSQRK